MPTQQRQTNAFSMGAFHWWLGVVESRDDPEKIGRVKVRIYGYHSDDTEQISTDDLVWAQVMLPTTSSAVSGIGHAPFLIEGTTVVGFYLDSEHSQNPVVMGVIGAKATEKGDGSKGFTDPNQVYPRYDQGESDVNKMGRGETDNTVVQWRKDNVETGVSTADEDTWDEPETPFAAEFPYNHVYETEPEPGSDKSDSDPPGNSGHIQEFDDTPGAERIYLHHKIGTWFEWHPSGDAVWKINNDNYMIVGNDENIYIKGKRQRDYRW